MKYIAAFTSIFLTFASQILMKFGGMSVSKENKGVFELVFAYATTPIIILAFAIAALAAFLWTYALTELDFNFAGLLSSFSYILIMLASIYIFKETISISKWVGCAFIMMGIFFVFRS